MSRRHRPASEQRRGAELGDLSVRRAGAELLFQVFADRYERRSLLITSNLACSDWGPIFQGGRMTAA